MKLRDWEEKDNQGCTVYLSLMSYPLKQKSLHLVLILLSVYIFYNATH